MTIWIGVIFLIAVPASVSGKQCIVPVYCTEAFGSYPGWMQVYPSLQYDSDSGCASFQGEPKISKNSEIPFINVTDLKAELHNMSQSNSILLEKFGNLSAMVDRLHENNSKLSEKIDRLNENNTKLTEMLDSRSNCSNKNNTKLYERNAELNKELELQATTDDNQTEKSALLEGIGSKIDYQRKIRLVNGSLLKNGRVEVLYNGTWGTVCDDLWSGTMGKHNADVVCKQLGFRRSTWYKGDFRYGMGNGKIWLDQVQCTGSENFISDCQHLPWGTNNCNHNEDVAVECE